MAKSYGLNKMTELEFFPISFDSIVKDNKNYVRVFGRTVSGKRICVYEQFDQYFWSIPKSKDVAKTYQTKINNIRLPGNKRTIYVKKTELHNKKYLGKDVAGIKVFLNQSSDLGEICDEIKHFKQDFGRKEVDIAITKKYIIDKKITPLCLCKVSGNKIEGAEECDFIFDGVVSQVSRDIINPKILSFDIEVYNAQGRYPTSSKDPIIMVAFKGNDGFKKIITWKKFATNLNISFVENEGQLINKFKDIIKQYKPDYLVGYYSDGFDFPYLKERADKHKIKLNLGLDGSSLRFNKLGSKTAKIKGFAHIDVFKVIKDIMSGDVASGALQLENFDLGSVSKLILGKEKDKVDLENLGLDWTAGKNLDKYYLYNLKDAELCLELFEKVLDNVNEIIKLVGMPIQDVVRMSYGQMVEWYIIRNVKKFNEIVPNKPGFDKINARKEETFKGGLVYEPNPGLYGELVVLDFRSLYPTIITSHNICVSTLNDSKEESYESPEIDGKRYYFNYKFEGFLPLIIKELIERRIRIKEMIKKNPGLVLNARSYALKILANSFWGYFGFFGARWYRIECAKSITAFARDYLMKLVDKSRRNGFKIIYGDTDGVFLSLERKTEKDVLELVREFNSELPSLMELEFDKKYNAGIFVMKKGEGGSGAKKKYALIDDSGKIKVRGFETVRRDWSYLAKKVQEKVLEIILKEKNKVKALEYVKTMVDNVKNKRLSVNQMVIRTQLKKNIEDYDTIGPHVAVARRMRRNGMSVGPGIIIKYVVGEGKGLIRDKARSVDEAEDYDADYYIEHQIVPAVERIFDVIGYSKSDLMQKGTQSRIGDF